MSTTSSLEERTRGSSTLLNITESAVQSLISNEAKVRKDSEGTKGTSDLGDLRPSTISPITVDSKLETRSVSSGQSITLTPASLTPDLKDSSNNSSSASEVIVQSTTLNPPTSNLRKHVSSSSATSSVSSATRSNSSLGSGTNARRVKVKAKFLREIKSPFENEELVQPDIDNIPPPLSKVKDSHNTENIPPSRSLQRSTYPNEKQCEIVGISNRESRSLDNRLEQNVRKNKEGTFVPEVFGAFHVRETLQEPTNNNNLLKNTTSNFYGASRKQVDSNIETTLKSDLFKSEKGHIFCPSVLTDEGTEMKQRNGFAGEMGPAPSIQIERHTPRKMGHLLSRNRDVSTGDATEVKVTTVPEQIVTITASNMLSTSASDKSSSFSEVELPRGWVDPGRKPSRGKVLRQGSKVDSTGPLIKNQSREDQVHIYQYKLNDKQKLLKESFAKRPGGPVKKVVQAQFVDKEQKSEDAVSSVAQPNAALSTEAVATASAIAASSAVVATQPILKAQQELEGKLASLIEEISSLKRQPLETKSQEVVDQRVHDYDKVEKVEELEKQLEDVTRRRLDYLEKMQQQQMEWQLKLLSLSRGPKSQESRSGHIAHGAKSHHYSESNHEIPSTASPGYYINNRHSDFDIHKSPGRSHQTQAHGSPVKSKSDSYLVGRSKPSVKFISPSKDKSPVQWMSPLDTPAPRKGPPVPTSYDRMRGQTEKRESTREPYRSGQLLEAILSHESPLAKPDASKTRQGSVESLLERDIKQKEEPELRTYKQFEPAPLDQYMYNPPPPSVDMIAGPLLSSVKPAPKPEYYTQAEEMLQQVQKSRFHLENNLQNMLRARREDEIYSLMDNWTAESCSAEKTHIKKLVDGYIDVMNDELEKELLDEMAKFASNRNVTFEEPTKDTCLPVNPVSKKSGQPKGMKGRLSQVQAKINTGRKKGGGGPENESESGPTKKSKEVHQPGKTKVVKAKKTSGSKPLPFYEDEEYLARIYGKAIYQNKRTTVKSPYLHFQNDPKPKSPRRPAVHVAKGVEQRSARTQTAPQPVKEREHNLHDIHHVKPHYYFDSQQQKYMQPAGLLAAPVQGQLIPMAVPLRPPRVSSGLSLPITITTSTMATNIPITQPKTTQGSNVAVVTVESEDYKKLAKLSSQVLPPVDIDSLPPTPSTNSEDNSTATVPETPLKEGGAHEEHTELSRKQNKPEDYEDEEEFRKYMKVSDMEMLEKKKPESEEDYDDDGRDDLPESEIALPGYRTQSAAYNGPPFPPMPPPPSLEPVGPSSDILAADLRRRNLLQNKAQDWIEQELMARLISHMYPPQPKQPSHHVDSDKDMSEAGSETGSEYVEPLSEDGFQLFVDAGVAVDDSLVSGLVREVLMEKISGMLSERDSEQTTRKAPVPARQETNIAEENSFVSQNKELVSTPEVTPRGSPVTSLQGEQSPKPVAAVRTPVLTPQSSLTEPESEAETTVLPTLRLTQDISQREGIDGDTTIFNPRQDVKTPPITPPLSPPAVAETPPPSIETPPPRSPSPRPPSPRSPYPSLRFKEPSPPPSPQPWGDPDSPLSEDNPHYGEMVVDRGETQMFLSVAVNEPMSTEEKQPIFVQPVAPPVQDPVVSPAAPLSEESSESYSVFTTVTETVNQSVSEGEWLISRSEGELEDKPHYHGVNKLTSSGAISPENSLASTLHGTDDLSNEKDDSLPSEGEFIHKSKVPFERDPMIALLAKVQQPVLVSPPEGLSQGQQGIPRRPELQRSLGEIRDLDLDKAEVGQWVMKMGGGQRPAFPDHTILPEEEYKDSTMKLSDLNGNKSRPQSSGRIVSVAPFASSTPERVTVKPRLIQVGGTGSPDAPSSTTRNHPQLPTAGKQTAISAMNSPRRNSREFLNAFPGTSTMSDADTRTMTPDQINIEALLQSGYLTQTFSSDGGNSDLAQSGNHTRTLSHIPEKPESQSLDQSGRLTHTLERTAGLNQSGGITHTLDKSEGFNQSRPLKHTLEKGTLEQLEDLPYKEEKDNQGGLTRASFGEAAAGPLKMSVTIPSIHGEDTSESGTFEVSDVSEISAGGL